MKLTATFASVLALAPAAIPRPNLTVVNVASGHRTTLARGPEDGWTSLRWTADGRAVLGVAFETRGLVVRRYPGAHRVRGLGDAIDAVLSRDGRRVAALYDQGLKGDRGGVIVRDVATGRAHARVPQSAEGDDLYENGLELAWSRDGRRLAYLAEERRGDTLRIVDADSGRVLRRIPARSIYALDGDAFSPDGERIAYASGVYGRLTILDVASGRTRTFPGEGVRVVAWAPAGDRIAYADGDGVHVGDTDGHFGPVRRAGGVEDLRWSPNGTSLALLQAHSTGDYTTALAVLAPEGALRKLLPWSDAGVSTPQWSPDGTRIALSR